MKKSILLIGGAGYIGPVVARDLLCQGYYVTCFDNLIYGFIRGSILNRLWGIDGDGSLALGGLENFLLIFSIHFLYDLLIFLRGFIMIYFWLLVFWFMQNVYLHFLSLLAKVCLRMIDVNNTDVWYATIVRVKVLLELNVTWFAKLLLYIYNMSCINI